MIFKILKGNETRVLFTSDCTHHSRATSGVERVDIGAIAQGLTNALVVPFDSIVVKPKVVYRV